MNALFSIQISGIRRGEKGVVVYAKIRDVQNQYPDLSDEAVILGLESTNNNEVCLWSRSKPSCY